jgi:redox-sensitive bicupin YhaK (pirin superfamily)
VIVRAASRGSTEADGLVSRHSFSYGGAYDPANTHFGLLLACNEDRLAAGAGFPPHHHRDVEVLTWVVSGALTHTDDAGHRGEARPGVVQRMSAGTGVRHSEYALGGGPAHYVQMWVRPASYGAGPAYDTVPVGPGLTELTPLRQPDAVLLAGRLTGEVTLAPTPYLHLLVITGTVHLDPPTPGHIPPGHIPPDPIPAGRTPAGRTPAGPPPIGGGVLGPGDALRVTGAGRTVLRAAGGAEILVWRMRSGLSVG